MRSRRACPAASRAGRFSIDADESGSYTPPVNAAGVRALCRRQLRQQALRGRCRGTANGDRFPARARASAGLPEFAYANARVVAGPAELCMMIAQGLLAASDECGAHVVCKASLARISNPSLERRRARIQALERFVEAG